MCLPLPLPSLKDSEISQANVFMLPSRDEKDRVLSRPTAWTLEKPVERYSLVYTVFQKI